MDSVLRDLGEILIKSVPTFIFVVILHFYLKYVFFRPLNDVLKKRYEAGEGARKAAEAMLRKAEEKTAETEARLQIARNAVYRDMEEQRARMRAEQDARIEGARRRAASMVAEAEAELAREAAAARETLRTESEALANQIAETILARR
jgi:F-type H+-transporting ATPase subunit b